MLKSSVGFGVDSFGVEFVDDDGGVAGIENSSGSSVNNTKSVGKSGTGNPLRVKNAIFSLQYEQFSVKILTHFKSNSLFGEKN